MNKNGGKNLLEIHRSVFLQSTFCTRRFLKENKKSQTVSEIVREYFDEYKIGMYLCTPLKKNGGKHSQKIFESWEITALFPVMRRERK